MGKMAVRVAAAVVVAVLMAAGSAAGPRNLCFKPGNMPACMMKIHSCLADELFDKTPEELNIMKDCCIRLHGIAQDCEVMMIAMQIGRRDLINPFLYRMMPMIHMCCMDSQGLMTADAMINGTAVKKMWQRKLMEQHKKEMEKMIESEVEDEEAEADIALADENVQANEIDMEDPNEFKGDEDKTDQDEVDKMDDEFTEVAESTEVAEADDDDEDESDYKDMEAYQQMFKVLDNSLKIKSRKLLWKATETCSADNMRQVKRFSWCMFTTCVDNM